MTSGIRQIPLVASPDWQNYELLDSGDGRKLERFGKYTLIRPEAEAIWTPNVGKKEWEKAAAEFVATAEENGGHWTFKQKLPESWMVRYKHLKFKLQPSGSKQVGIFPEQATQWDWIGEVIRQSGRPLKVLNLFGYTGAATLAAASAGASVTHLDASKKVIGWGKENQELSGLQDRPIRWILDDALKFVQREQRRDSFYDGIILDPPKFGRGPKGEVWEFFKLLPNLLADCKHILTAKPAFLLLTAYAVKASAATLFNAVDELMAGFTGNTEAGEVVIQESGAKRQLSMAVFARWSEKR